MKNLSAQIALLCSSSIVAFAANSTLAQTGETESTDIENVLTIGTRQAYKGEFTALETPQAELTLDAENLRNAGALDLTQALDLSSSVARQNNFGGLWNSFAIRGFVGDGDLPSNYLVNGFNAGRGFGGPRDLSGVESVEVLKGPRAALFGRGEPGGTINLVTKRPTFEQEGELRLSAGSFQTYRTDVDWTTPIGDMVAIRLVGFYEDAESFRDTVETKKQGLSPSIAFRFNDQSQLVYEIEYSEQDIPFDRGVVAFGLLNEDKVLGVIPESRFLGEPGDGPIETDVLGHQIEFQHDFNDDWHALIGLNYRDTSLEGLATESDFYFGRQFLRIDGENLTRFRRYRDYDATYQVLRGEISGKFSTGGIDHKLIIGVDADEFENDQFALRARGTSVSLPDTTLETNFAINIFNPVYGAYEFPELTIADNPNVDKVETQKSLGFFVQDQISVTDQLDIRFGARIDDYDQELINRRIDEGEEGRIFEFSETKISPQLGLVYKASDSLSLYAVYGENFRPITGAADDNNLDPNESKSFEIGINFSLNDGALNGNIAIFDIEQSNTSTITSGTVTVGAGEAGSQGIELDLNGQLSDTLSILLSYTYLDAESKDAFNDPGGFGLVPAGSDLLNIPENQLSLQLVQDMQLAGKTLSLIGGFLYVDERNGFFSDQDFKLPSYTTVQIAANYQVSESIELRAEINNLFDEEYYSNSFANVWVQPGAPTNGSVSATLKF